jgi:hypothetical protein
MLNNLLRLDLSYTQMLNGYTCGNASLLVAEEYKTTDKRERVDSLYMQVSIIHKPPAKYMESAHVSHGWLLVNPYKKRMQHYDRYCTRFYFYYGKMDDPVQW